MIFDVTINTDDNYIQHCIAMLCSLYENNIQHTINLHVLKKSLSQENEYEIRQLSEKYNNQCLFYTVDDSTLEGVQFRKIRPLSKAAYYRLLLSSVIDESIDQVLYLDCDMIVLGDVSSLFKLELDNYALAATLDESFPYTNQHRTQLQMEVGEKTFCSGLMLVNLKYWREHNVESLLLEYAKRHREEVHLHDQDVLNYAFKKCWFMLPPKWNRGVYAKNLTPKSEFKPFDYYDYLKRPIILHYAAKKIKPWYNCSSNKRKFYINYLNKSGFKKITLEKVGFRKRFVCLSNMATCWFFEYIYPYSPNLLILLVYDIKELLALFVRIFKRGRYNFFIFRIK